MVMRLHSLHLVCELEGQDNRDKSILAVGTGTQATRGAVDEMKENITTMDVSRATLILSP